MASTTTNTVTDPVCGMEIDAQYAAGESTYDGKTISFCSKVCKIAFDAEPERFSKPEKAIKCGCGSACH